MSVLDVAEQHLTEALSRLENALAARLVASDPDQTAALAKIASERDALRRDVEALRHECARLNAALREAEQGKDAMRKVTDEVAERLDGSIEELSRVIEG